ncbi:MAG: Rne/Rng family ribonuclease [Rhodospirillales bacterium]|nr:Rne/Rng family ribonuclease [Rhodospirillales bacterium]
MIKRMLIDAAHPEETRVVLLDGNQIEDFDVEVSSRRQLKGNIYLAKVVRVEPSLQAAFVDYGGNRHGFLAFSEIHPDYYQIPVSDREHSGEHDEHDAGAEVVDATPAHPEGDSSEDHHDHDHNGGDNGDHNGDHNGHGDEREDAIAANGSHPVETVGGDDEADEIEERHPRRTHNAKQYKIQEVIKRRQVLLIQVVKEERGNKGAALTTYMSLAGRYCVLMPNTARGGGISRKITNSADRKSLKTIMSSLEVPEGMAVILRTAGIGRTKVEIKRDFEYLTRLWTTVRDTTLQSTAPALVHEEGDIVRRSIRDLYSRDIEEVQVEGDEAYKAAKEFMKLLMPSHARRVKQYKETDAPLLRHFGVEGQLDAIHNPIVHLPSGGYLVINPTEALVSVDVNSGKSTKERNIEETALKTNLEAASELARQLRLRDLAGLIVIDFIDMEVNRNNAQVERRMKDALKHDRARIQVGRISPFGLLEMSRQRLRPSLIETSSEPCPYCSGTGIRRSTESTALVVLRAIDEEGANRRAMELTVHMPTAVALYILNHKRSALAELEAKHAMHVLLTNDDSLIPPDLRLERTKNRDGETISEMVANVHMDAQDEASRKRRKRRRGRKRDDEDGVEYQGSHETYDEDEGESEPAQAAAPSAPSAEGGEEDEEKKGKRRRRSRRGGRRRRRSIEAGGAAENATPSMDNGNASEGDADEPAGDATTPDAAPNAIEGESHTGEAKPKRRRSRRRRKPIGENAGAPAMNEAVGAEEPSEGEQPSIGAHEGEAEPTSQPRRQRSAKKTGDAEAEGDAVAKPRRTRSRKKPDDAGEKHAPESRADAKAEESVFEPVPQHRTETPAAAAPIVAHEQPEQPKKKGWWNIGG